MGHLNQHAGNKAQLHQPMGEDFGKLEAIEDGGFAEAQSGESLQAPSIGDGNTSVKDQGCEFNSLLNYLHLILLAFYLHLK